MDASQRRFPLMWVVVIGVALLVLAVLVYESMAAHSFKQNLPQDAGMITFTDTGLAETFALDDTGLASVPPSKIGDYTILESVSASDGTQVVIATTPTTPGAILGVVDGGSVRPLVSDGTSKTDLHVTKSGDALYAVYAHGIVWAASVPQIAPELTAPAPGDVEGHASGPMDSDVGFTNPAEAAPVPDVQLFTVDIAQGGAPRSLGAAKDPRIRADGSLIALTPEGVAHIDLKTGAHTVIVPRPHGDGLGSTLSKNGTAALFRATGSTVGDVYAVGETDGQYAGTIVFESNVFGGAFADDSHLFIRTALNRAALYNVKVSSAAQPPSSTLPVVISQ